MWQVIEGSTKSLDDVTALLRRLDALKQHPAALARSAFVGGRDVVVARAPSTRCTRSHTRSIFPKRSCMPKNSAT